MNEEKLKELFDKSLSDKLEEIKTALDEKVDAHFKELGLDKTNVKNLFKQAVTSEEKEIEKKGKIAKFMKAVYKKDEKTIEEVIGKEMSEAVGSEGGFLVPEEFAAEVRRITEDYGLIRKFSSKFTMGRDTLNLPTLATSVSVTWPGENNAATKSQPVYNNVQLSVKTAAGLTVMSNELLADANVDIVNHLMELFSEALAGEEDSQGFSGTGSPFVGILQDTDVNIVTMGSGDTGFSNVDLNDLRDLITQIKVTCLPTSAYFMHREIWAVVQKLLEDSQHVSTFQNPILTMLPSSGGAGDSAGLKPAGMLWGYPVYLSDQMPGTSDSAVSTTYIVFGSMQKGVFFGDRQQVTLAVSDSATVDGESTFERNQAAVRVTERVAITVGLPSALAALKTAAS